MSKLVWDKIGERFYETGIDHAVLYPISATGVYDRGAPPAPSPTTCTPTTSSTWCWWAPRTSV